MINKNKLKKIIKDPMDDKDIKYYLPKSKIKLYSDLADIKNLDEILQKDNDYMILLYPVESVVNGHWVCVMKYSYNGKKVYEYYDSYGHNVDEPLSWLNNSQLQEFNIKRPYLSDLFDVCQRDVIYNPTNWQSDNNDVNSCGRHVCFRVINLFKYDRNLGQYYKFMKKLKKDLKMSYDDIVSYMIDK